MNEAMTTKLILSEIRTFLNENSDSERAMKYARYFKEGFDSYGVHQDLLFAKRDEWLEKHSGIGIEGFLKIGDELFQSGKYEEGSLAILFLEKFKKQYSKATFHSIGNWFDGSIGNWAHTDYICSALFKHFLKKDIIAYHDFDAWRNSPSKWKRRAVPVGMLPLLKTSDNFSEFFAFLTPMMLDKERPVQQGLGWFLREAWKKKPDETEEFLLKWKNSAPRLIFQYATEKMSKDNRLRFRKEKELKPKEKK